MDTDNREMVDEWLMELVEPTTKAIMFEDCGSTADWQDNTNLGIAAVRAIASQLSGVVGERDRRIDELRVVARRYAREFLGGDSLTRALAEIDEIAALSDKTGGQS